MFSRFYNIAANTFLETIRQPIYGVMLFVTAVLLILNVGLAGYTLENDDKLLVQLGLSTLLLSGLFLSVFCATGVLTHEIENKTVLTIVSKPVSRTLLIAGKYGGLMAALALAFFVSFLVFLITLRHQVMQTSATPWDGPALVFGFGSVLLALGIAGFCNYLYNTEFSSTALALVTPLLLVAVVLIGFWDKTWNRQPFYGGGVMLVSFYSDEGLPVLTIFKAAFLVMLAVMVLAAAALAASTRLGQVMTLLVCVLVTIVGLISDFALGQYREESAVASFFYHVLPNFGFHWVTDAVNARLPIPWPYVGMATAYSALLALAMLLVGAALFQRREVG